MSIDDFYAFMPMHSYIFAPTGEMWPAGSVNSRIPPVDSSGKALKASDWLDRNRPVEQMTWAQLERHAKPILLADINEFWRPLLALFAHMHGAGFIRRGFELRYLVAEKIEDVVPMLRAADRKQRDSESRQAQVRNM